MKRPLVERWPHINVLILDVDGVLTDGRVIYSDAGHELQEFHTRDGSGLSIWRRAGYRTAIITGRGSKALERRTAELGIDVVLQKVSDKAAGFAEAMARLQAAADQTVAIGDDLPDLPMLRRAAVAAAVADACAEVKAQADWITLQPGGRGAVREVIERVLKEQGRWSTLIERFAN
jgi:3-deoxy-D-manno-octulosonate 8-phosphate phosphatase (KDO 8-P phosphatase)